MTTVQTRARTIAELEGFDIIVTQNGQPVDPHANGLLGPYGFDRKLKHTKTVADWRRERFQHTYPRYSCEVLNGDGTVAEGQTGLRTVRETYEDE